jgi:hypothetical protein
MLTHTLTPEFVSDQQCRFFFIDRAKGVWFVQASHGVRCHNETPKSSAPIFTGTAGGQ